MLRIIIIQCFNKYTLCYSEFALNYNIILILALFGGGLRSSAAIPNSGQAYSWKCLCNHSVFGTKFCAPVCRAFTPDL